MEPLNDTTILDSREKIAGLDQSNLIGSIEALADQVKHAWESTQALNISLDTARIKNVIVTGMGGSALGADVCKHLFAETLKVPFEVSNNYALPAYVNENSLVVLSSYSGSTEEIINCAELVKKTGAQVLVMAAGGKLAEIATSEQYPTYLIDPVHNPSNQPRMAIGYTLIGLIGLLVKAGVISITDQEIDEVVTTVIRVGEKLTVETPHAENQAKILAFACVERRPILVGSEFLVGAVHTATNQFNENAKIYADYKIIPELNHHLMEALKFPKSNPLSHLFIFFRSALLLPRNQKRMTLTQQVVENNGLDTLAVELTAETKFAQALELITLMAYTNFYLSMLEGINPAPIPFVDWFKEELAKA